MHETHAILFDVDGTLLDSTPAFLEITRRACRSLGWPEPQDDLMRQVMTLRRQPAEILFPDGFPDPAMDPESVRRELSGAAMAVWEEVFEAIAHPFSDSIETLRALHAAGYRLGVVTDSNHQVVRRITRQHGCPPLAVVVTREEAGVQKPDPTGIRLAVEQLGLAPDAVLYIGDNPIDIEAAHGAGVRVLGITTGPSLREDFAPFAPHGVIDALAELPALVRLAPPVVTGQLTRGLGEAGAFLRIDWVREQIEAALGGPFHAGTLNLECSPAAAAVVARQRDVATLRRYRIEPQGDFCAAWCHAVELSHGELASPGLLLWPEVPDYPATKLELILPQRLEAPWPLAEGTSFRLRYRAL